MPRRLSVSEATAGRLRHKQALANNVKTTEMEPACMWMLSDRPTGWSIDILDTLITLEIYNQPVVTMFF